MKQLGFGLMRLPILDGDNKDLIDMGRFTKMVDTFMESGFSHFDTAYGYHGERSESAFREAVVNRYDRGSFTVTDKMPMWLVESEEDLNKYFMEQLERCGVDYFDFYWLHALSETRYQKCKDVDAFGFLERKKREGFIRKTGFSFHDSAEVLNMILTEQPEVDYVQLQINYLDWEDEEIQSRLCYETAVRHGKRIMIMEPVKGGTLASLPSEASELFKAYAPDVSDASWAIRYAASLDSADYVLSGMSNEEQLLDNIKTMRDFEPLSDEEREVIGQVIDVFSECRAIACTGCGYCLDGCPRHIAIPDYFTAYNNFIMFGEPERWASFSTFRRLGEKGGKADDCIACGACESVCPQHLPIIDHLESVAQLIHDESDNE
ncbi:MAG TPA: 4Fe-4S dicluster domain-containing protein [Clostridiaceae bacterium]|jgi:predicted aldo/keto reductase-like oxidoreductase|nr:4Fe-4S dicluster domain-containing protein [Clostridiaceae bacterium]